MEPPHRRHGAPILTSPPSSAGHPGPALGDADLDAAILAALEPSGILERVRLRLGGGYTAVQVFERIDAVTALDSHDPVEVRAVVARVQRRLVALSDAGRVRRTRSRLTVPINTKGPRDVVVDVFRLARRADGGGGTS